MPGLKSIVKRTAAAADRVIAPPAGVTILIYHRVGGGSDSDVDLAGRPVRAATRTPRRAPPGDLARPGGRRTDAQPPDGRPTGRRGAGDRATTGDAGRDHVRRRHRRLHRARRPGPRCATTCPPRSTWPPSSSTMPSRSPGERHPPRGRRCATSAGDGSITIGSHTHSHWLMDRLDPAMVDADLDRSIDLIGDHLGVARRPLRLPEGRRRFAELPRSPSGDDSAPRRWRTAGSTVSGTPTCTGCGARPCSAATTTTRSSARPTAASASRASCDRSPHAPATAAPRSEPPPAAGDARLGHGWCTSPPPT